MLRPSDDTIVQAVDWQACKSTPLFMKYVSDKYAAKPGALVIVPKEQAGIAAIFSDMDADIAALEPRREKTRLIKQSMLQHCSRAACV